MSRDPGSTWRPLPEGTNGAVYPKTQLIVHSTGTKASAAANARYFARANVSVESHFIVGYGPDDPTLQIMDTHLKADANTTASRRAISIEVVGTGDEEFTDWQVSEIIRIGRWAHEAHGITLRVCPAHDASGYGWHVMFGAPGPWTTVRGKVCPGDARIEQLEATVFPAIFEVSAIGKAETPAPAEQEDDMTDDDRKIRNQQHDQVLKHLEADRVTAVSTERIVADVRRQAAEQTALLTEIRDLLRGGGA